MAIFESAKKAVATPLRKRLVFLALLVVSYAALAGIYVANRPSPLIVNHAVANTPAIKPSHIGIPSRLQITDVAVDVIVQPGIYNAKTEDWSIGSTTAQYAEATPPVNDGAGTTLIYGHNNRHVFEPLFALVPGALAVVTTDDGQKFTYKYDGFTDIATTEGQTIKNSYAPTMKLLTCSGPNYSRRTLFNFSFVKWEAA